MPRIDLTASAPTARPRDLWPLLVAIGGVLAAWPLYIGLLDNAFIRASGLPMFLLTGAGAVAGAMYVRWDDRWWVRFLGTANVVSVVLVACWFFWWSSFPAPAEKANSLITAPDFALEDHQGRTVELSHYRDQGPVLLVFYRGSWCPFCVSELKGLGMIEDDLKRAGVKIVAVSVDEPSHSRQAAERLDLMFPLLSDQESTVIDAYGLVHPGGGPGGVDTTIPAQFLIDQNGRVLWRRIAGALQDRASPEEILTVVRQHVS